MLKMSSTCINAHVDRAGHKLSHPFKGPAAVANFSTGIKIPWRNASLFSNWSLILSVLTQRTEFGRTWKEGRGGGGGLQLKNRLRTYTDVNLLPCFGVGNSLLKFVHIF